MLAYADYVDMLRNTRRYITAAGWEKTARETIFVMIEFKDVGISTTLRRPNRGSYFSTWCFQLQKTYAN